MDRERLVIGDAVWEKIAPLLPGKKSDRGVTAKDNRLFLEAVLWRVRAGLPWRDLPPVRQLELCVQAVPPLGMEADF